MLQSAMCQRWPKLGAWLVLILAGGAALVWTARAAGPATSPRRQIVLAVPAGGQRMMMLRQVVDQFHRTCPEVEVKLRGIPGGKYYQKVLVMLASRTGPDVMWMGQSFSEFADREVFLDLSPYIARDLNLAEYHPQAMGWYRYGDRQFGIPTGIDIRIMVYNEELFDEEGLDYPKNDWTFAEFLEKAKRLTKDRDGDGRIDQYGYIGILEQLLFDAQFIADDGARATCNTPEMLDYLQTNVDLAERYRVSPTPRQMQQTAGIDKYALFRQGRAAIMMMASWDLPALKKQCADLRWDVVLNPQVRRQGQWASSQSYTIWAQTPEPDACWELCKLLCGPSLQKQMAFAAIPTHLPTLAQAAAEHRGRPANVEAFVQATRMLDPTPRVPDLQELQQLFHDACQSVFVGRADAAEAMDRAQRRIDRAIRKESR
ncbi:MAG: sugar ABC transporter substrate-binding protein [Phycisphaerae bacterium]|nr:sugar ABC transporter substrate-binding protein [Phycisphaerae bacterium]